MKTDDVNRLIDEAMVALESKKREWVGLTDEEISEYAWMGPDAVLAIKEAQEILKERNT